jgi:hypothetical protein
MGETLRNMPVISYAERHAPGATFPHPREVAYIAMRRAVKPASVIEREKEKAEAATAESAPRERSSMATSTLGLRPLLTPPRSARGSSSRPENQTRGSGPSARPLASPTNRRTMNLKSPSARRSAHERLERMTTTGEWSAPRPHSGESAEQAPAAPPPHNAFDAAYSGHSITPEFAYRDDRGYCRWTGPTNPGRVVGGIPRNR